MMQPFQHRREHRRRKVFQNVPDQDGIEMPLRKIQRLLQEVLDLARVRLIHRVVQAESVVKNLQKVGGIQPMAEIGNKAYILLSGYAEIENAQSRRVADVPEK